MSKLSKLEIKQKRSSKGAMTGSNTEVLLDGKKLLGVKSVGFEVMANGLAKVHLEILGNFSIAGNVKDLKKTTISPKTKKLYAYATDIGIVYNEHNLANLGGRRPGQDITITITE